MPTRWRAIIWTNDDYFTNAYMRCNLLPWVTLSTRYNSVLANNVQGKHMLFYFSLVYKRLGGYMWKWCDWCSACMRTASMACGPALMHPPLWWLRENTSWHGNASALLALWTSSDHLWIHLTKCTIRTLATSLVFILFGSINTHLTSLQCTPFSQRLTVSYELS